MENISKTYKNDGKEFVALEDVSLSIREGEIFGIIGMSGAGKSTLVRTLNRLEEVSAGTVKFYGNDLASLKTGELRNVRHSISMIFQSFNLLQQRTVIQNVEQPLRIAGVDKVKRREIAEEMLAIVGLSDKKILTLHVYLVGKSREWRLRVHLLPTPKCSCVMRRLALWILKSQEKF